MDGVKGTSVRLRLYLGFALAASLLCSAFVITYYWQLGRGLSVVYERDLPLIELTGTCLRLHHTMERDVRLSVLGDRQAAEAYALDKEAFDFAFHQLEPLFGGLNRAAVFEVEAKLLTLARQHRRADAERMLSGPAFATEFGKFSESLSALTESVLAQRAAAIEQHKQGFGLSLFLIGISGVLSIFLWVMVYRVFSENERKRKEAEQALAEEQGRSFHSAKLASLGEMAGGIAHEINNPLAIIEGYSRRISRLASAGSEISPGTVSPLQTIAELSQKMRGAVDRISRIVSGLRVVSRDATHDPKIPVPVAKVVEDALGLAQEKIQNAGIRLEVAVAAELWVEGREVELSQVLINLLNNAFYVVNARKSSDERWIKVITESTPTLVRLCVLDSGPGVPAELREKIMQPLFTTKPPGEGTGLGLSISRAILENHGGRLYLHPQSLPTKFIMELPLVAAQAKPLQEAA